MDNPDTEKLYRMSVSKLQNFTVLLNRADSLLDDEKINVKNAQSTVDSIRETVYGIRNYNEEADKSRIILSCFNDNKALDRKVQMTDILIGKKLKSRIYEIIKNTIKDLDKNRRTRDELTEIFNFNNARPLFKKIIVFFRRNGELKYTIKKPELAYVCEEDEEVIDSFTALVHEFQSPNSSNPIFQISSNPDKIVNTIEDILDADENSFRVISS